MDELAITPEELAEVVGDLSEVESTAPPQSLSKNVPETDIKHVPHVTTARPAEFAALQPSDTSSSPTNLNLLLGVTLRVTVELGRAKMSIEEILKLGPGSVIELDKQAGEPVDVLVNDRLIARGEVVVIDDRFGVRITDVLPPVERINSLQ